MRTLRLVFFCLALPAVVLLAGLNEAAAEGDARELCTGDALRLCNEFIPDVPKITRCMIAKRAQLSPACRGAMHPGWKARGHQGHQHHYKAARHCGRHGRHCG
jgi:hypothetical protein